MKKQQEELFEQIKFLARRVDDLKGFVQNDFQKMIDNGDATEKEIKNSSNDVENSFNDVIDELQNMKTSVLELILNFKSTK